MTTPASPVAGAPVAGAAVVAILDIGGLDRRFVPRGTRGVVESRTSSATSLVRFDGVGAVDVDDVEIGAVSAPSPASTRG
ncbi:hypothetical protein [Agrococcus versicolor]